MSNVVARDGAELNYAMTAITASIEMIIIPIVFTSNQTIAVSMVTLRNIMDSVVDTIGTDRSIVNTRTSANTKTHITRNA